MIVDAKTIMLLQSWAAARAVSAKKQCRVVPCPVTDMKSIDAFDRIAYRPIE